MNRRFLCLSALAIGAALSIAAAAQPFSRIDQVTLNRIMPRARPISAAQYKREADRVAAEYMAASAICDRLPRKSKNMCAVRAKVNENIRLAELDARFRNTEDAYREARLARAKAAYATATQECESIASRARLRCLDYAKALYGQS